MAKKLSVVFGIVFVLVGILGFIPNPIVGAGGYFVTDAIHNIIHLLVGIVLLIAAGRGEKVATLTLRVIAIVYLLLAVVGFIQFGNSGSGALLGIASANAADNWLHLVLGIVIYASTLLGGKKMMDSMSTPMAQ